MTAVKLRIIEEVRKRPFLWNYQKFRKGRNQDKVEMTWTEIGKKVGVDGTTCKSIWKQLRLQFCNEANHIPKRIAKAKEKGEFDPNKKYYCWEFFDALRFVANGRSGKAKFDLSFANNSDMEIVDKKIDSDMHILENTNELQEHIELQERTPSTISAAELSNCSESSNLLVESSAVEHYDPVDRISNQHRIDNEEHGHNGPPTPPEKHSSNSPDLNDEDYSFLYSFLAQTKVMTQLQNKEFRVNMKNLLVDIFPASASVNILEKQLLLPEDSDPDRKFLISFWPFLKSMSLTQNVQFRAKMANLVLKTLLSKTIL